MKRLLSALLLCASPALAQANSWQEIQNGWGEIQTATGGGAGTPGGADTQVQINDGGAFYGNAGLTYQKASNALSGTGPWTLTPGADIVPLTVRAYSSGTNHIAQFQDSSNGFLAGITHTGGFLSSALTSGRVPIVGTSGLITDDAGLTYNAATDTLSVVDVAQNVGTATTFRATAPATITITNTTNATPIEVTATAHGLVTGDLVSINGVTGNTNANGFFRVTRTGADTFTLQNYSTGANIAGNGAHGGSPLANSGHLYGTRVLAPAGTSDRPGIAFADFPGWGITKSGNAMLFTNSTAGGTNYFGAVGFATQTWSVGANGAFAFSQTLNNPVTTLDTWITRGSAAATLQLGAAAAAAPVGQRLQAQGAVGTNLSGADLIVAAGGGTGLANTTAAGRRGDYRVRTQVRGTTGTTADTTGADRYVAAGQVVTLTESSATPVLDVGIASGSVVGGSLSYTIRSDDATDFQSIRGTVPFTAVNKAGTITVTLGTPVEVVAASSGTLTNTVTLTTGSSLITLNLNAVSSLTQTTLYAYVSAHLDGQGVSTTK